MKFEAVIHKIQAYGPCKRAARCPYCGDHIMMGEDHIVVMADDELSLAHPQCVYTNGD